MNRFYLQLLSLLICISIQSQVKNNNEAKIDSVCNLNIPANKRISILDSLALNLMLPKEDLAYLLRWKGILYNKINDIEKGILVTKQSIKLRKQTNPINHYRYLNCLYNLSYLYKKSGDYKSQKETVREILSYPVKNKFTYQALIYLAYTLGNEGDYFKAIAKFQEVIPYAQKNEIEKLLFEAYKGIIWCYFKIDESKKFYRQIKDCIDKIEQLSHPDYFGYDLNNNLAHIYDGLGNHKKALELHKKVEKELNFTKNKEDLLNDLAKNYSNQGRLYNVLNNKKLANNYFRKALGMATDSLVKSAIYCNMGDYQNSAVKLEFNRKAIATVLGEFSGVNPKIEAVENSKYKSDILDYLLENVQAELDLYEEDHTQGNLNRAIETCDLVDRIISGFRKNSDVDLSKLFWIRKAAGFYMNAVSLCYYKKDPNKALYYMEKNKGLLLLEGLYKNNGENFSQLKPAMVIEELQYYLNNNKVVVEYILNEQDGYGLFCNEKEKYFFKLDNVPELIRGVTTLKKMCTKYFSSNEDKKKYFGLAAKIFTTLLPDEIGKERIEKKELVIIPDGVLQYINFETLVSNGKYVVDSTEISYLLSLSIGNKLNRSNKSNKEEILGFAPVHFQQEELVSLERSTEIMEEISKRFASTIYMGNKASSKQFNTSFKEYAVVHLNTHAGMDNILNQPWIAFHDRKLILDEISELKNNTELVVLDVCNGAFGNREIGEGVMSLARGFFSSGSKAIITTQWEANEKAVNEIMASFYRFLAKGKNKSKALHLAKKAYINNHQLTELSPYYWGALILTGNAATMDIPKNGSTYDFMFFMIAVMVLLLLGAIFLRKQLKNKKQ